MSLTIYSIYCIMIGFTARAPLDAAKKQKPHWINGPLSWIIAMLWPFFVALFLFGKIKQKLTP